MRIDPPHSTGAIVSASTVSILGCQPYAQGVRRVGGRRTFTTGYGGSSMRHTKHRSTQKGRKETVPALGVVGMSLSLVGGAPEATAAPTADSFPPQIAPGHDIILNEEEVADVSLATFYVFDKENAGTPKVSEKLAGWRSCGGCAWRGCRGCAWRGCRGCAWRGCRGCGWRGCRC